jgi:hypothetical protein
MQVGDLVKDRHGNMGIITEQKRNPRHVWVQWCCGDACTVHTRHLEVVCK